MLQVRRLCQYFTATVNQKVSMNNVLILSAGRRVELAQSFKFELNARSLTSKLFATDLRPELSAACQVVDFSIKAPRITDSDYLAFLLEACEAHSIGLVIPTIDTELLLLAQHRKLFSSRGIHLVVSDESLVMMCRDKRLTAGLFDQLNIDAPEIYERSAIKFPCFAKPYDGSSGVGAISIETSSRLSKSILDNEKMMFMELIDGSHAEFTVDAYYSRDGILKCLVPRERLEVRAGEISKGITRRHHVYDYLLPRLQRIKGARGCITLQLFASRDTGRYAAIEINPRFGGGYPLTDSAGAKYSGWLIDEYLLGKNIQFHDAWEANLMMLRYDAKVLVHEAS